MRYGRKLLDSFIHGPPSGKQRHLARVRKLSGSEGFIGRNDFIGFHFGGRTCGLRVGRWNLDERA